MTRTHGLDEARLERIGEHLMTRYVEPGKVAGCQALVARHGQVAYSRSFGLADRERGTPVRDDTIWRIYSMTKPITSVALMTLYERGLFQLTDPVHRFVPEWRGLKVCEIDGVGGDHLVELERPPTVRDVLTHTSGLSYGFDPEDPVDRRYTESGLTADFRSQMTLEEMARRLGDLPLRFQPGARWRYSFATDVCARLVEIISGRKFGDYLQEAIFDPLGMPDTGFVVPESARDRFAANYYRAEDKTLVLFDDPAASPYLQVRQMQSGGGGLVSTMPDYLRFVEMLRGGGELDGARVLGRSTIHYMTRNHLPGGASLSSLALGPLGQEPYAGIGFGLGFAVTLDPVELQTIASPGDYYWGGAAATLFWIDPVEDMIVIFMVQHMQSPYNFRGQLQQLVHQAIVS
ncbi:MAG TPA: serine hydrolase domain-containing protein [Terriglobales bacterium]|nr:serine hydrolase domain-containing protein [Terriglobales bacterium]